MKEWLVEVEQMQEEFAGLDVSEEEMEERAEWAGFRSARAWKTAREDVHKLLKNFVHAVPFQKLWAALKENDQESGEIWGYAPGPAGVPNKLVEALQAWHQAPKFTTAERRAHSKKIADACEKLEELLGQLEPTHEMDSQFSRFRFVELEQAEAVFKWFETPTDRMQKDAPFGMQWLASRRLQGCGVVPIWAVRNIRHMASNQAPNSNLLPAKVRAKAAKKTYFIAVVSQAIDAANPFGKRLSVGPQLIADIVELISDMDCTADDVRKAAPKLVPED
ncbi:hypothetical protein [Variovorax sp. UC122_21]|uniref:hypothetical protein n=1 Tax=Variovorax sp. UC122_21 TaxID=3374554 RepID=UPI003756FDEC